MSLDNTKQEYQRLATVEVVGFMELQVHPKVTVIYINLNPKGKMRLVSSAFSALQNVGPVST